MATTRDDLAAFRKRCRLLEDLAAAASRELEQLRAAGGPGFLDRGSPGGHAELAQLAAALTEHELTCFNLARLRSGVGGDVAL